MRNCLLFLFLPLFFAFACEKIEAPYYEESYLDSLPADEKCLIEANQVREAGQVSQVSKKVLLEEMTGHQCGNCPSASLKASELQDRYGEDLIFMAIHAGPLANVKSGSDKFTTDFRTSTGNEWYTSLNDRNAVPFGMVDRSRVGTNPSEWEGFIDERLEEEPQVGIDIYPCMEADSSELGVVVYIRALKDLEGEKRLSLVLVEAEIVDWQKDYRVRSGSPDIPDYVHKNVLRRSINGSWGDRLRDGSISASENVTFSYGVDLAADWKLSQLKLIAFVHDFSTRKVLQAEIQAIQK